MILKKKETLVILFLFLIASFFRFYNLEKRALFFADEERDAYVVYKTIIKDHHLTSIGPSTSVGNIYLGPAWYYWLLPWYLLFNGNPLAAPISTAFIGAITTVLFYLFGKEIFDKRIGFFSAIIYGTSYHLIKISGRAWNPSLIPLISLIFIYSLFKLKKKEEKYWWLIILCLGLGIQFHLTAALFFPALIFFILFFKIKLPSIKKFIIYTLCFIFFLSPLIFFDLRHNFWNSKATFLFIKNFVSGRNFGEQKIIINPYYFLIFSPAIIYLISFIFSQLDKICTKNIRSDINCDKFRKRWGSGGVWIFLTILFIIINFFRVLKEDNKLSLFYKNQAVKYTLKEVKNEKFKLVVFGQEDYKYGIRYLFYYFGKEPEESPVDQDYQHFYKATKGKSSKLVYLSYGNNPEINRYCNQQKTQSFGGIKICVSD